ncbi:hypothetical protein QE152_g767 [Popillia japonica]|uniref:Uncharacterized protein n=1 Tax=Popillia japonica TaxID=7064 RepID=A0AAW1NBA2_POPJA
MQIRRTSRQLNCYDDNLRDKKLREERNVKCYLDLDSSTENEVQNEQLNATSETSPDQESINRESSVSSEDMEEAFISRGKVTSSGRVTKPPQRLDLLERGMWGGTTD